jgi:hypothetical protein
MLLQVHPDNRPTCGMFIITLDQILRNPMVQKRIEFFKSNYALEEIDDPQLLQTIKVPKNMLFLTEKLPKPNYEKLPIKKNLSFSNNETDIIKKKKQIKKNIEKELKSENMDGSYLHHELIKNDPVTSNLIENLLPEKPQTRRKKDHSNSSADLQQERKLPQIEHKYILPSINSNENRNYINKISINEQSPVR